MTKAVLGIIGGSGIYDLPGLEAVEEIKVASPWGEPSDLVRRGRLGATDIVFLPRHGRGHVLGPSDINYRANIDVLKRMGVTDLVSLSAVGSFKGDLPPGTFVLADQFIDRTFKREPSFFGAGCVAHVAFSHPVAPLLQKRVAAAAAAAGIGHAVGGTSVCMEGPAFSTLAESLFHKAQGWDLIGMTSMPEAKLAREAEIAYCFVGMVTDFDAWHEEAGPVDVALVMHHLNANADKGRRLVARLARDFPAEHEPCPVGSDRALEFAIVTAKEQRDPALLAKLDAVAGRVL
ncbi:S-methyl-5'-thioadenosine phosphorylase [Phreatobacter stygius]|uniref:S-methyl-5'-thioadenosine phosphorylase n=1 Tax=Phreatobacter stygius TaxID=1940610 RepID=A0A4D7B0A6_9HYPH|nr:S-methyl-5'-thioadenosine phosphorylase [Phreatobacter stygius]QCI63450.1 S-methyl-5'-thioadenosine phosphorylase [Phreatobacter stygius]